MQNEFVTTDEVLERITQSGLPPAYFVGAAGLYESLYLDMYGDEAKKTVYNVLPVWAVFVAGYMMAERVMHKEAGAAWRKGYRACREDTAKEKAGIPTGKKTVILWKLEDGDIEDVAMP